MIVSYLLKNGVDILLLCLYHGLTDPKIAFYTFLKAFSMNYCLNFSYLYPDSEKYKWKHMVRLTDTGHIANFLFYFYPEYLPLCYNVHFVISSGYYITTVYFGMKDNDEIRNHPDIFTSLHDIYSHINHTVPYLILLYSNTQYVHSFDQHSLYMTYAWIYCWFCCVYIPWRYYANDPIYSILNNQTSNIVKIIVIITFHILIFVANETGKMVQTANNQNIILASFN